MSTARGPLPVVLALAVAFAAGGLTSTLFRSAEAAEPESKHLLLVLSNAHEGAEDAFNTWYTHTHLPDIIATDGFKAAQRFRLASAQLDDGDLPYRYLAIYHIDADDVALPRDALRRGIDHPGAMSVDPALDLDRTVAWFYTPITGLLQR